MQIGVLDFDVGEMPDAKKNLHEAVAISRDTGDQSGLAGALSNFASVLSAEGNPTAAKDMLEECLRIWRQAGEKNGIASALVNLADVRFTLGDLERSQKLF